MDDSFFAFAAGSAAVVREFGWVISVKVGLSFEAQMREFEGCKFSLRGNNGRFLWYPQSWLRGILLRCRSRDHFSRHEGFLDLAKDLRMCLDLTE